MRLVFLIFCSMLAFTTFSQTPALWIPKGIGGGGAIQNPAISPFNGNRLFMSCDMSEMFETTDYGQHWHNLSFNQLEGGLYGKVCFTQDSTLCYAIGLNSSSTYAPKKSTDGGLNWSNMSPNPCVVSAYRIFADPQNGQRLLLSDKNHIYFSNNGGSSYITLETDAAVTGLHLAGVFFDGANIYVCSNKKLFISGDGGNTFPTVIAHTAAGIAGTEGVVSFAGARQGANTRFYCTTIAAANLSTRTTGADVAFFAGLYTMRNPFSGWNALSSNLAAATTGSEKAYYVAMLPTDTSTVYLGGSIIQSGATFGTVYKTTDSGNSWSNLFLDNTVNTNNQDISTGWVGASTQSNYAHTWVGINTTEGICIDPNNINRLVRTDKSAIHTSVDGGNTWQQAYVNPADAHPPGAPFSNTQYYATSGLETTVNYWLTWIDSLHLMASVADISAILSNDGGHKWSYDYNPNNLYAGAPLRINDVVMTLKHPQTQVLYAATGDIVGSNGVWDDSRLSQSRGRICFSSDNGHSWQVLHDFGWPVSFLEMDHNHPDTMYACVHDTINGSVGGIYRCNAVSAGAASVWTRLNAPARADKRPSCVYALNDGGLMAAYYPLDSTGAYQFAAQSGVFYSADGGNSWSDRTAAGMKYYTFSTIPDTNDSNQQTWWAFVGAGGSGTAGLYRSVDRGLNWVNVMPGTPVLSATFHPSRPNEAYICSQFNGLYYATGTNSNVFVPAPQGNYPFRSPQRVFFNPYQCNEVWISSFGNGLSVGYAMSPVITGTGVVCQQDVATYSIPAVPGTAYHWTVTGGNIISGGGLSDNMCTVMWTGATAGTITVTQSIP